MPIEIRELVIRASVAEAAPGDQRLEQLVAQLKAQLLDECMLRLEQRLGAGAER